MLRLVRCRARNPRFLTPHFGQKTGFRARNAGMNEIKSGIPCSGKMYVGTGIVQFRFETPRLSHVVRRFSCMSPWNLFLVVTKSHSISRPTHRMTWPCHAIIFCAHILCSSCKVVTKGHRIPENQRIASHATIFCNHLAKFMLPKRRFWKAERTVR